MIAPFLPLLPLAQIEMDPLSAAVQSRGMVLLVLIALVLMSVASWVVIGSRLAIWPWFGRGLARALPVPALAILGSLLLVT